MSEYKVGQRVVVKLPVGRIVDATIKAITETTEGSRFQASFGNETALFICGRLSKSVSEFPLRVETALRGARIHSTPLYFGFLRTTSRPVELRPEQSAPVRISNGREATCIHAGICRVIRASRSMQHHLIS